MKFLIHVIDCHCVTEFLVILAYPTNRTDQKSLMDELSRDNRTSLTLSAPN